VGYVGTQARGSVSFIKTSKTSTSRGEGWEEERTVDKITREEGGTNIALWGGSIRDQNGDLR